MSFQIEHWKSDMFKKWRQPLSALKGFWCNCRCWSKIKEFEISLDLNVRCSLLTFQGFRMLILKIAIQLASWIAYLLNILIFHEYKSVCVSVYHERMRKTWQFCCCQICCKCRLQTRVLWSSRSLTSLINVASWCQLLTSRDERHAFSYDLREKCARYL